MGNVKLTGKGSSADQGLGEFLKYCYVLLQNKSYAEEQILNTEETNVFYKNLVKGFCIANGISVDKLKWLEVLKKLTLCLPVSNSPAFVEVCPMFTGTSQNISIVINENQLHTLRFSFQIPP